MRMYVTQEEEQKIFYKKSLKFLRIHPFKEKL